jgi:hypothetical protein
MIKQLIFTLEAIGAVRHELEHAESVGDIAGAANAYDRLCNLYASISTETLVSELKQVTGDNVLVGNFQAKRKAG